MNKSDSFHTSIREALLPVYTKVLETSTGIVQMVNRNAEMTKTLGIIVAIMVSKVGILFGTVYSC
jgi:hypothetical protein